MKGGEIMKKIYFLSLIGVICLSLFITTVNASTYTSTLSLGDGRRLTGATRSYTAGTNKISIYVNSFTRVNGLNYTKLNVTLATDTGTSSMRVGTTNMTIDRISQTYTHNWGYLSQADRYYSFSTIVDNYNYGGLYSSHVEMSSGN